MKNLTMHISAIALLAVLAGCTSTPEKHTALEQLRAEMDRLASQPYVSENAPQRFRDAEIAIERAEKAWERDADDELVEHYVYLADRRVDIVEEAAKLGLAEKEVANAESERRQVMLEVREAQAQQAQARASQAELRAEALEAQAQAYQSRAQELEQTLLSMESEVASLKAERTEAGIVLTLEDILFDVNKADLKPGADRTLDRVAEFLNKYEDRELEINGYTDATGSEEYNEDLSAQRAQSVQEALVERGVSSNRISIEGLGESNPVASNETPAGRQQNRRVEIVVENIEESVSGL